MLESFDRSWREMIMQSESFQDWQILVSRYTKLRKDVYGEEPKQSQIPEYRA